MCSFITNRLKIVVRSHRSGAKLRMAQFSKRVISKIKERLFGSNETHEMNRHGNILTKLYERLSILEKNKRSEKYGTRSDLVLKRGVVCDQHLSFRNVINFFQNTRG